MRAILGLTVLLVGTTSAVAGPREALDFVRDAIEAVTDEGGRCKKDMLEDLEELEDDLRDRKLVRAQKLVDELANDAGACPKHVGKLLRRASDSLREDDRRDRDDRRRRDRRDDDRRDDRVERKPPERAKHVPWNDWVTDCKSLWMVVEIARYNTDDATLNKLSALSGTACQGAGLSAPASWPNGTMAKATNGAFYYPNGTMAKASNGAYYYPNGTMAKASNGAWYYPNGTMARASSGTWYYANGTQAGGFEMLVSDACSRAGDATCKRYNGMLASDLDDWRAYAVVQLVTLAGKSGR